MSLDPKELVARVTRWTLAHPDERDPWEKAPAMSGVLAWDDAESVKGIKRWIDRAVDTQGSDGYLCYSERIDLPHGHVRTFTPTGTLSASIGAPMLQLHERKKEPRYLEAAKLQAEAILRAPRTRDGGISCRQESKELWIDFIYLMGPFLARYGRITGESRYLDEAFAQYEVHGRHLIDPFTGLTRHAWCETPNHFPQSTLWARGNGWLVCAAVELLEIAPDHAAREVPRRHLQGGARGDAVAAGPQRLPAPHPRRPVLEVRGVVDGDVRATPPPRRPNAASSTRRSSSRRRRRGAPWRSPSPTTAPCPAWRCPPAAPASRSAARSSARASSSSRPTP